MQWINHWPAITELTLPELVAQDLYRHLLLPFDTESIAREFWEEAPSTVIILNDTDTIEQLKHSALWEQIAFALTYPEYTEPLAMHYQVMLTIMNDSGSGLYLVIPPELSNLASEISP